MSTVVGTRHRLQAGRGVTHPALLQVYGQVARASSDRLRPAALHRVLLGTQLGQAAGRLCAKPDWRRERQRRQHRTGAVAADSVQRKQPNGGETVRQY